MGEDEGEQIKGEGKGGQLIEEEEAGWAQEEEKDGRKKDWVEIIQEDPWTGEWTEFQVPRGDTEKEWKRLVYSSSPQPWASRCSWTTTPRSLHHYLCWPLFLGAEVQEHLEAQGWRPLVYRKPPSWGESKERERRRKFKAWQQRESQRQGHRPCTESPGKPRGESPFRPWLWQNPGKKVWEPQVGLGFPPSPMASSTAAPR